MRCVGYRTFDTGEEVAEWLNKYPSIQVIQIVAMSNQYKVFYQEEQV